ncbi:hypothetical protein B0H66DRAFT_603034 [Apodospora peruviana]|uniref:Uncharacterized protein n=1 Tax=Apodospora peruviana TaxID=516989 RepID=A0AAE0I4G6_9PEZI|nr:hypothetical protein B0H66DRAFT_603034 [Apodospora peruviana]
MNDLPPSPVDVGVRRSVIVHSITQLAINNHLQEISALMQPDSVANTGSVLALVTLPRDCGLPLACDGRRWMDMRYRMSYDKLVSLGSSKINNMFEPRCQERLRRRHGMQILPPGIEYVLDFTPPAEGAELADLTAALWLPKVVKLWFLSGHFVPDAILEHGSEMFSSYNRRLAEKAVGACLVLGHDDVCKHDSCVVDTSQWEVKDVPGIADEDLQKASTEDDVSPIESSGYSSHIPPFRKIDDYCAVRHRVSIMRVLRAINGQGLVLNSATRMWTVAQVAIHLEVPQVVVDPVTQWLIAPPNSKFIEICPERAFQLALALKIPSVLTAAFKILVNEVAVDMAAPMPSPNLPQLTWAQRKRDDYGESDAVDYASRAYIERMNGLLEMLRSDDVLDRLPVEIPQWTNLRKLGELLDHNENTRLKLAHKRLVEALVTAFHRQVEAALEAVPSGHLNQLIEAQRAHYIPNTRDRQRIPLRVYYSKLSHSQRILIPFFWNELRTVGDFTSFSWSYFKASLLTSLASDYNDCIKREFASNSYFFNRHADLAAGFDLQIFYNELRASVSALCKNHVLNRISHENTVSFCLTDHLNLTLEENELKFLPIWADGLDDGTGGVFQDAIPPAEMGPSEPGPAYHTGYTVATGDTTTMDGGGSTIAPSDLDIGNLDLTSNTGTVPRSMDAEQSVTTGPARNRVVSIYESSEKFSANDVEYSDAMFAQPAAHQALGQALTHYADMDDDESMMAFEDDEEGDDDDVSNVDRPDHEMQAEEGVPDMVDDVLSDTDSISTLGESDYDML